MRIIFSLFLILAACLTNISEARAALTLRTINFTTGSFFPSPFVFPPVIAPPVTGSISVIFDNSNPDITINRNPAIINSLSLPFSTPSTFEIAFNGFNLIYGNSNGLDLSSQQFDFALILFPSVSNRDIQSSFRYFDPVRNITFSSGFFTSTRIDVSLVPEPSTWMLLLFGFGFIGYSARLRRLQNLAA
jgi:hypothetical protein